MPSLLARQGQKAPAIHLGSVGGDKDYSVNSQLQLEVGTRQGQEKGESLSTLQPLPPAHFHTRKPPASLPGPDRILAGPGGEAISQELCCLSSC